MPRDERGVVALFRNHVVLNEGASKQAGRAIYDDVEVCELRFAGSKNIYVFPALSMSHWDEDGEGGLGQREITYAERFSNQYRQFKAKEQQTKAGTPLDYLPFLSDGKRAELRALNIYTADALSIVDGAELKNLGPGGRALKDQAIEFLKNSTDNARITRLEAELEAMRAKNQVLADDLERSKILATPTEYDGMTDDELRAHVKAITGVEPKGNLPRKTLIRMAQEHKQGVAA